MNDDLEKALEPGLQPRTPTAGTVPGARSSVGRALDWYPKVFGPGDIDGEGAKRLLGTPNIPAVSVLVRETAQNSWDARTGNHVVTFKIHLRQASSAEQGLLRTHVFTGDVGNPGLRASLSKKPLWLLEVSDRGTRGLGGPVRNDLEPPPNTSTDFIDLIFNVGAPRDVHLGAGTYGFGKTITYKVSRCGSVLFWTRTHDEHGNLEDRLIGSAIGSSFSANGRRYTGRHWWGRTVDDRVEPVTGAEAEALGRSLFADGFEGQETGTSLLIVDPDLGGESPEEDAERLAAAAMWHLWPKMVSGQGQRIQMTIEVWFDGVRVDIPDPASHPVLMGPTEGLSAVRAAQQGVGFTPRLNTVVYPIWCQRPRKLLGHLALTRFAVTAPSGGADELAPLGLPTSHVVLMRHDAELVVKYEQFARLDHPTIQWSGVFKPVAQVDDSFALAEPPAHDDWAPESMSDRAQKRDVRVALRRIREMVSEFLRPAGSSDDVIRRVAPVAALADRLSGLVGGAAGNAPGQRRSGQSSGGVSRRASARVTSSALGELVGGWRRGYACVTVSGPARSTVRVHGSVAVGVEGGSDPDDQLTRVLGWSERPRGEVETAGPEREFRGEEEAWLVFDFEPGLAVDVRARIVEDGE